MGTSHYITATIEPLQIDVYKTLCLGLHDFLIGGTRDASQFRNGLKVFRGTSIGVLLQIGYGDSAAKISVYSPDIYKALPALRNYCRLDLGRTTVDKIKADEVLKELSPLMRGRQITWVPVGNRLCLHAAGQSAGLRSITEAPGNIPPFVPKRSEPVPAPGLELPPEPKLAPFGDSNSGAPSAETSADDKVRDQLKAWGLNPKHAVIRDGAVSVYRGHVDLDNGKLGALQELPVKFHTVIGDFNCHGNNLVTMKNFPDVCRGSLSASNNKLTSLAGCPKEIRGDFTVEHNKLTSLMGGPESGVNFYDCSNNELTSLHGAPKSVSYFLCASNKITSLAGGPVICDTYGADDNSVVDLKGAPTVVHKTFSCRNCKLKNLEGTPRVAQQMLFSGNQLSNLLGLEHVRTPYLDVRDNPGSSYFSRPAGVKEFLR